MRLHARTGVITLIQRRSRVSSLRECLSCLYHDASSFPLPTVSTLANRQHTCRLSDGTAYVDARPLLSNHRLGLVYKLLLPRAMADRNTAKHAVEMLNQYEKEFLDGLATWRDRIRGHDSGQENGIHRTAYYILNKRRSNTNEFNPSSDLTLTQKFQLAWLRKLCMQTPGKRIGDTVYNWELHVDLAALECRTTERMRKNGTTYLRPGFQVAWTASADMEANDWNRNEGDAGTVVEDEAIINFGGPVLGSSGCDEYLVRHPP